MNTLSQSLSRAVSLTLLGAALLGAMAYAHDLHREAEVTGEVRSCEAGVVYDNSGQSTETAIVSYRYPSPRGERLGRGELIGGSCERFWTGRAVCVYVSGDGRDGTLRGERAAIWVGLLVPAVGYMLFLLWSAWSSRRLAVACSQWCAARASSLRGRAALTAALVLAAVAGVEAGSRSVTALAAMYALATVVSVMTEAIVVTEAIAAGCAPEAAPVRVVENGPYRTLRHEPPPTCAPESCGLVGALAAAAVVDALHANGVGPSGVAVMVPTLLLALAAAWRASR